MPLVLLPMTPSDTMSWTRVRALAYRGPTNDLVHTRQPSEESFQKVAQDRRREVGKPNNWHWKVVDTDLTPSVDDPGDNGGRTIAVAVWSAHNLNSNEGSIEPATNPAETDVVTGKVEEDSEPFVPPEVRLDVIKALLGPLHGAGKEIMGSKPYLMLNSLATQPEHQQRGAGTILLKWGLEKADEAGLEMYLNTSKAGRVLYEKWGFELVRGLEFDRRPWGGEGIDWHGCMVRKARERSHDQS